MKVVLFCGGQGLRIRADDGLGQALKGGPPKPMLTVGGQPILMHIMRWYAEHGHRDFILCLGYGAHHVRNWVLENGGPTLVIDMSPTSQTVELQRNEMRGWRCTFSDTGPNTCVGQRLRAVRTLVEDEE